VNFLDSARTHGFNSLLAPLRTVTKPIHAAVKDASAAIANSPWSGSTNAMPNTLSNTSIVPPTHRKHPSGGSVPSTPMSAALGPAAQATMPTGSSMGGSSAMGSDGQVGRVPGVGLQGQKMAPGSRINFFERHDRFERESRDQGRPSGFGYGRRG
jgi:hypothetical protein